MVSCIFFSDPSVVSVAKESWARLKNYYVDEYFAFDQRLAVVESTNDDDTRQHAGFEEGRKHGMSNMSRIEDSPSPEWTTGARFNGSKTSEERSAENRQPSSISRVDTPERSAPLDDQPKSVTSRHRYFVSILFPCISKKEAEGVLEPGNTQGGLSSLNPFWHNPIIPMHRVIIGSGIVFDAEKNELYTASPQPDSIGSHNAFAAEMKRSEIGRQCGIVEPYEHPHFAKTVHWFLIHICRVKAPDRDGLEIEPRNQPGTNTHRLLNGCSGSFQLRKLQHVDRITSQPVSYISEATSASSATGKTTLDSRNEIKSTAWQATKQPEPMVSRHDIDLKGKAPITSRWDEHTVTNADREPVSSSPVLQPGRDDIAPGKQRLRPRSELVLRVTDPTDQQKEEKVFLLTSADPKDSLGPVGAQGSPRVRRMTADSLPAKSDLSRRAIIHHMWGRSANIRTKRVRRVKDLAGKMGETMFIHRRSSVISNRPRSKSSSRPRSRSISGAFWSPPATPSPPPSPSPGSTPSITCLNFTRLTARPKGHYPKVHPICHVPTQLAMEHTSPTVAKDFGHIGPLSMPESWTSSSPKIPDMARRTQDMGRGFRNAVVSIAYIADGWDDNERDRVHISEVTWDIESLVNELMD
ncbi:hypothetical protein BX666DRAFT_677646 [Dichotomocladium elegans]|nr:hypothetical protein BX666DRAFT_677646 [Dichotomocladium elegans]